MSRQPARFCFNFHLSDAAADWAGAALSDLFSDGLLLAPLSGGVVRLKGWLRPGAGPALKARALQRLRGLGAKAIRVRSERPQPPKALHGRFPVLRVGPFQIVPASKAATTATPKGAHRITLIQGQAFGTGLHESTRLMLGALVTEARKKSLRAVLDVGAGSGILGLACLRLGAVKVDSVELEAAACAEMRENRSLNQVPPRRLPVYLGAFPLKRLRSRYPLVLGNLVTPVLSRLMPRLAARLAPKGVLLMSGIHTAAEARSVAAAARQAGLKAAGSRSLHRWHVLRFYKP